MYKLTIKAPTMGRMLQCLIVRGATAGFAARLVQRGQRRVYYYYYCVDSAEISSCGNK